MNLLRCLKISRGWAVVLMVVMVFGVEQRLSASPYGVFIVHCEPKNADAESFLNLRDLVVKADQHGVKLTIDFTPQWAEMILDNAVFLNWTRLWDEYGHELAVHHHPYWISAMRGTTWDGYTNTPLEEIAINKRDDYLGNMDDYLALLNRLPGARTSGTLGISQPQDTLDWPDDLRYSAEGHELEDIVGRPQIVEYAGHAVWQMSHGLFWSAMPGELQTVYANAEAGDIVAVVTHVSNYEASPPAAQAVENYFAFLGAEDPSGDSLVTVTEAMILTIPEPSTLILLVVAGGLLVAMPMRRKCG